MKNSNTTATVPPLSSVPNEPSLDNLPKGIQNFSYDQHAVIPTHVHIGLGWFSMAHLAAIANQYMNETGKLDWGIVGVSMHNRSTIDALAKTKNRIVLSQRENSTRNVIVVGSIIDTIFAPDDPQKLVERMSNPQTKLISFTVTAGGHHVLDQNGNLNLTSPEIVHDLNYHGESTDHPHTIYWPLASFIVQRMQLEKETGIALPCTILSADNVARNSATLKTALQQYIKASFEAPEEVLAWLDNYLDFRITVVDRITPKDTIEAHSEFKDDFGFDPAVLVNTEMRWQLAVQNGRFWVPDWQETGVKEVSDIELVWKAKYLGLNSAHQILGNAGLRLGLRYIYEVMELAEMTQLVELFHAELATALGYDLMMDYGATVRSRFADHALKDQNRRVCAGGRRKASERVAYAYEVVVQTGDGTRQSRVPIFTFANWLLNLEGIDERGIELEQDDPDLPLLADVATDVSNWLRSGSDWQKLAQILRRIGEIFADNRMILLASRSSFLRELAWSLAEISEHGILLAARHLLER